VGYFAANVSDLVNNPRGWITLYTYTDMQNSLIRASDVLSLQNDGTRNFNSQGRPVFDPANPNKYWFTRDEILPYFDGIDENIDDGNVLEATRDSFYNDWILVNLAGVQYGDYIYINSIVIPIRCEGELLKGDLLAVLWLMFERNWYYYCYQPW
jgi:hypothetical protein